MKAQITGKTVDDVFVIPRSLLRENSYVLIVDQSDGRDVLRRRPVSIAWETDDVAVVSEGLNDGDLLCLTQVPLALEEYPVRSVLESEAAKAAEEEAAAPARRGPPPTAGGGGGGGPGGGILGTLLAAIPADKPLPAELKTKLDEAAAAAASGDRSKMRPAMAELREWAEANGVELPAGRGGR